MKKVVVILMAVMLVLVGCSSKTPQHQSKSSDVIVKIENKESFVLYIGSTECAACQLFAPVYTEFAEAQGDSVYSLEVITETGKRKDDFEKLQTDYIGRLEVTPTILFIKDGVVVEKTQGALKLSELENTAKRFGFIK